MKPPVMKHGFSIDPEWIMMLSDVAVDYCVRTRSACRREDPSGSKSRVAAECNHRIPDHQRRCTAPSPSSSFHLPIPGVKQHGRWQNNKEMIVEKQELNRTSTNCCKIMDSAKANNNRIKKTLANTETWKNQTFNQYPDTIF